MIARFPALIALLLGMLIGNGAAHATLATTHTDTTGDGAAVDGTLAADEYGLGNGFVYAGGGGGFGGTLGLNPA